MNNSIKVLIVEDDDIARLLETRIVQECNCEVDSIGNGTEALELIDHNHYDLVLMDIGLPDRDGIELTQKIRATIGENQKVPIIALTSHEDKTYHKMASSYGMNSYIVKPLTTEKYLSVLKSHVEVPS